MISDLPLYLPSQFLSISLFNEIALLFNTKMSMKTLDNYGGDITYTINFDENDGAINHILINPGNVLQKFLKLVQNKQLWEEF